MSVTPWVVFDTRTGLATCLRCGEKLNMHLPQPLRVFVMATEAFRKMHQDCRETDSRRERNAGEGAK